MLLFLLHSWESQGSRSAQETQLFWAMIHSQVWGMGKPISFPLSDAHKWLKPIISNTSIPRWSTISRWPVHCQLGVTTSMCGRRPQATTPDRSGLGRPDSYQKAHCPFIWPLIYFHRFTIESGLTSMFTNWKCEAHWNESEAHPRWLVAPLTQVRCLLNSIVIPMTPPQSSLMAHCGGEVPWAFPLLFQSVLSMVLWCGPQTSSILSPGNLLERQN